MEPVRGMVSRRRPVAATWLQVDGVLVKSNRGNCSIDNLLSTERRVICCLELDILRVLTTFAERLAGRSGVDTNSTHALEGFRMGPQPEGCCPLVLMVIVAMLMLAIVWRPWEIVFLFYRMNKMSQKQDAATRRSLFFSPTRQAGTKSPLFLKLPVITLLCHR
jgi:hypothetical protein